MVTLAMEYVYCEGMLASFSLISMLLIFFLFRFDECTIGNDTCHINATSINTVGSYMTVNVHQVSWEMDSIVQVSMF